MSTDAKPRRGFHGEKLKDLDGGFWPDAEWSIRVVDATGAAVCAIRVSGN